MEINPNDPLREEIEEVWRHWPVDPVVEEIDSHPEVPTFPMGTLPGWMKDHAEAVSGATQTPLDFAAMLALSALSAVCGGKVWVQGTPGWVEPTCLYVAIVARPGSRKSAVFGSLTAPLREWEKQIIARAQTEMAEAKTRAELARSKATAALAAATKAPDDEKLEEAAAAAEAEAAAASENVKRSPRVIVGDVTPEKLAELMGQNGGRIALMSDEGGIFDTMSGRYSSMPNLEVFLQGYSGTPITVDRRNMEDSIRIERPALTVGLTVQPKTINDVVRNSTLDGRGLVDRFLFVQPESTLGKRDHALALAIADAPATQKAADAYTAKMLQLFEEVDRRDVTMTLSKKARLLWLEWVSALEPRLDEDTGDLATLGGWGSKMFGNLMRIAGLLHVAESVEKGKWPPLAIDEAAMKRAIEIADYLVEHAISLRGEIALDPISTDAAQVLRWLRDTYRQPVVSKREVQVNNRGICKTAEDTEVLLLTLAAQGWITRIVTKDKKGVGRPSQKWALHQSLLV